MSQQLSSASRKMPPAVLPSSVHSVQLSVSHDLPSAEVSPGDLSPLDVRESKREGKEVPGTGCDGTVTGLSVVGWAQLL